MKPLRIILKNIKPLITALIIFCFWIYALNIKAQGVTMVNSEISASAATGDNTPFWLVNQKWGKISKEANNFLVSGSVAHYRSLTKDISLETGINLVGGSKSNYGNVWLQELFLRLNWKSLRLDIGPREDYTSFFNPALSSGDFIESNNSRPIPQIKISIPDFVSVPFFNDKLFVKGDMLVGYFIDNKWKTERAEPYDIRYSTDIMYHRKSLFFRIGNIQKTKMQFIFGLNHAAYWGGTLHNRIDSETREYIDTPQPQKIGDFIRVFIAKEGSENETTASQVYVAGSQWGAYVFKYDINLYDSVKVSAYINHFFDDGSGLAFLNLMDNLHGLEVTTGCRYLSNVVFEYIYTKQQSGALHYYSEEQGDKHRGSHINKGNGNDSYYNNIDYQEGPSYFGYSMGTPLFLAPMYNNDGTVNFKGTRIAAFHLGFSGNLSDRLTYRLLFTTGKNYGRHYVPFRNIHRGFASMAEFKYAIKNSPLSLTLSTGYDNGRFLGGKTFGGMLTVACDLKK
jgi:hypothetical protein